MTLPGGGSDGVRGTHGADDGDGDASATERARDGWASWSDRAVHLLTVYRLPIIVTLGAVAVYVGTGRGGIPELPQPVVLAAQGLAISAIPAAVVMRLIIKRYFRDPRELVLVIDPQDGYFADIWRVPPRLWNNREGGRYRPLPVSRGPIDYVVTRLAYVPEEEAEADHDVLLVEGCNPEVADPVEVTATEGKLAEVYEEAQHVMADLARFRGTWETRATELQARDITALAAAHEHGTAFKPGDATEVFDMDLWSNHEPDGNDERSDASNRPTLSELEERREAARNGEPHERPRAAARDGGGGE